MMPFVLYCKSYSTDLRRAVRLAQSVQKYNREGLLFYLSVPQAEITLFQEHLEHLGVFLISDEEIIKASPRIDMDRLYRMPGNISQQVIKSEFWRLGISDAYLCLDSDALFIRDFGVSDFVAPDGTPYTMIDEAHDLMEDALRAGRDRLLQQYTKEADQVQSLFNRKGRRYSFGPFPLVWHRAVWQSLDKEFLQPRNMNFADAIEWAPIESRWYGEALMAFRAVDLLPCQALFKVYHYAWQYDHDRRRGLDLQNIAQMYCGVILQSAWERDMDWPAEGGNWLSHIGRRIRRKLGRI